MDNQASLDGIYDELVHLRDAMGKKLGYEGYTTLGYYRMGRNCYTKADVEKFRDAVVKHLVPVADGIYRAQAKRLGKEYPMSFADNALQFRPATRGPAARRTISSRRAARFTTRSRRRPAHFSARCSITSCSTSLHRGQGRRRLLHEPAGLRGALYFCQLQRHAARRGRDARGGPRLRRLL